MTALVLAPILALAGCDAQGPAGGATADGAHAQPAESTPEGASSPASSAEPREGASSASAGTAPPTKGVRASDKREPSAEQLFAEQERIARGEAVDEALRRPRLRITREGVEVNGQRLLDAALSTADAAIDPALETWLRLDREHVRMIVPGRPFAGRATIEVEPGVPAAHALGAIATVHRAGFDAVVSVGDARFETQAPGAPELDVLDVRPGRTSGWQLRFEGRVGCRLPKGAREIGAVDELGGAVREGCEGLEGGCASGLRVVPNGDAASMAQVVAPVLGALRERTTTVTILPTSGASPALARCPNAGDAAVTGDGGVDRRAPEATAATDEPVGEPATSPGDLRFGALTVDGPLGEAELREAIESLRGPLLRCAAKTRATMPDVIGRLNVRGVALRDGRVAQLGFGSDLPAQALIDCAVARFADLRLPAKPEGTTRFSAAMLFAPR